jgi:hypothetical protein
MIKRLAGLSHPGNFPSLDVPISTPLLSMFVNDVNLVNTGLDNYTTAVLASNLTKLVSYC